MIAFLVVQMLGMTINMMIMFGLVLAVGVLVDDPIVVVEYAERKLQEGVSKKEAFILAARKMFVPVVSATFTTLGAFIPLLFWPGIIGKFMSYLPIIVIVVMCASLLSALVFMPVIGAIIASKHVDPKAKEAADIVMYAGQVRREEGQGRHRRLCPHAAAPDPASDPDPAGRLRHRRRDVLHLRQPSDRHGSLPGFRARVRHGERDRARQLLAGRDPRLPGRGRRTRSCRCRASRTRS